MGAARIVIISIAFVAAIGLAIVVRGMLGGNEEPAPVAPAVAAAPPMARVLVAKRDLPVGTRLTAADLDWQSWPAANLNPAFITDGAPQAAPTTATEKAKDVAATVVKDAVGPGADAKQRLEGSIVREALSAGEPVLAKKLVRSGDGGYMSVVLQPGMRAIGVPVAAESAAGGFILPGDHVDVIQAVKIEGRDGNPDVTRTAPVVVNVRVLAIDQKTSPDKDSQAIIGAVATLEVSPDSAEALVEAIDRGELKLALRSYADLDAPSGRVMARAPEKGPTVKVFRNGEAKEVAVQR